MTDPVLDTIDHVLHDWDTSADAMRWTPEPVKPPEVPQIDLAQMQANMRAVSRALGQLATAYTQTMKKAAGQIGKMLLKYAHAMGDPKHKTARCHRCRPYANPKPLAFGVEYHRRQKRRSHR